jgi:16S rRNA processing protein RimM
MSQVASPPSPDRRVYIGRIVKVRGLRGDLKILPLTWDANRFRELEGVWVATPAGELRFMTFKRSRIEGQKVFVRFDDAPRRDLAEPLVGSELFVDEKQRAPLPEDYYYHDDLLGCEVICSERGPIGVVEEILEMPANEVWIVRGELGEVLVPAVRQFVNKLDLSKRRIEVTLPEGLVSAEREREPNADRHREDQTDS